MLIPNYSIKMKGFVIVSVLVLVFLQAEGRSIGQNDEMPQILIDTMQQSFSCALNMGRNKSARIPQIRGIQQLPEDNDALNELWGCIWKKKGIIDNNSELNENSLEQYLVDLFSMFQSPGSSELSTAHEMVQQCKNLQGNDFGQTAVKVQNCINNYITSLKESA